MNKKRTKKKISSKKRELTAPVETLEDVTLRKNPERTAAGQIIEQLMLRHAGEIYTSEALIGGAGGLRMDFWSMKPTWTGEFTCAYEVKVSRSDFLQDNKWPTYMSFCNTFWLVCPHGIIQPSEVPKDVGLLYCPHGGGRLYMKKKATYRDLPPENLATMLRHVLMWRYKVNQSEKPTGAQVLAQLNANVDLDWKIKRAISQHVNRETAAVHAENEKLKEQNGGLLYIKEWLDAKGFGTEEMNKYSVRRELDEMDRLFKLKLSKRQDEIADYFITFENNLKRVIKELELRPKKQELTELEEVDEG